MTEPHITRFIRAAEFRRRLGSIGKTKFYELIHAGIVPRPICLGHRTVVWTDAQVAETSRRLVGADHAADRDREA